VAASDASDAYKKAALASGGYVCDGTDDDVEIQAAIDALPVVGDGGGTDIGGHVHLSAGNFNISACINVDEDVLLTGEGDGLANTHGVTRIYQASGSDLAQMLHCTGDNVRIRDLLIHGNKGNNGGATTEGIKIAGLNSSVENVGVYRCGGYGIWTTSHAGFYKHIFVEYCDDDGFLVDGYNNWFEACFAGHAITNGWHVNGDRTVIVSCLVADASQNGYRLDGDYNRLIGSGTYASGSGGVAQNGVSINNGSYNVVQGNVFFEVSYGNPNTYDGVSLGGDVCDYNVIEGNVVKNDTNSYKYGLDCYTGTPDYNIIRDNIFVSPTTAGVHFINGQAHNIVGDNVGHVGPGDTRTIIKSIDHADLTDDGGAAGHIDFDDSIPAESIIKAVKLDFTEAWNSDNTTTLTVMIGSAGDTDAFSMTADPGDNAFNTTTDICWGESDCQNHIVGTEVTPRVTFTEDDDITNIISGAGSQGAVTIYITYMKG